MSPRLRDGAGRVNSEARSSGSPRRSSASQVSGTGASTKSTSSTAPRIARSAEDECRRCNRPPANGYSTGAALVAAATKQEATLIARAPVAGGLGEDPDRADLFRAGDDHHLAVPLGHVVLGTAICLLALGLMEHDGVVIGVELVAAVLALVDVTVASAGAVNAVHHWFIG